MTSINYNSAVEPHLHKFPLITLTEEKEKKIVSFLIETMKVYRDKNELKKIEDLKPWSKMKLALCGEAALEILLDMNITEFKVNAYDQYDSASLFGGKLKINTFISGTLPIIYKYNTKSLIFVVQKNVKEYYICGLADRIALNSFRKSELVPLTEPKYERKAVYYGFDELFTFKDKESLIAAFTR